MLLRCILSLYLCSLFYFSIAQQEATQTASHSQASRQNRVIKTLKDCNFPEPLLYRLENLPPKEMKTLREEYQSIEKEDDTEFVVTVKFRFVEDYIYGYIKKAPLTNTAHAQSSTTTILIPIQYCCTPNKSDHQKHCATIDQIPLFDSSEKCVNWVLKEKQAKDSAYADMLKAKKNKNKNKVVDSLNTDPFKGLSKKEKKKKQAELKKQQLENSDSTVVQNNAEQIDKATEKPKSRKQLLREEKERMKKLKQSRKEAAQKPDEESKPGNDAEDE